MEEYIHFETNAHVVQTQFMWTIQDFSLCSEETGEVLISAIFAAGAKKMEWRMLMFAGGVSEGSRGYVSLYLQLVSSCKPEVKVRFFFSVLDAWGQAAHVCGSQHALWFVLGEVQGFEYFVERYALLDELDQVLSGDKLTILCEVRVAADHVCEQPNAIQVKVPECRLSDDLGLLFEDQKFSDMTLSACGWEFQAHKAILAARCPIFLAMFEHEMEERKRNHVKIIDVDHEVLCEMLHFIYTGKAPNLEKMADDLLYAADKYALERLKVMCEEALCRNLSVENAVDILMLADLHSADQLKAQSIDFINTHAMCIMETSSWKSMVQSHPHLIAELQRALAATLISPIGPPRKRIKHS